MTRTLLRHGRVLTPEGWATALLVDDDRIVWVGSDAEAPAAEQVIDLRRRLVTPAFVDAHVHLAATGLAMLGADLSSVRSAAEALDLLAAHAATTGLSVVLAHGWDDDRWTEPPSPRQLDEAVGGRPAYVSRVDMHSALASTALRERARRHGLSPSVDGWSEVGPLTRAAHHAVRDAMNALLTTDDRRLAIRMALASAARAGIGAVHEIGAPHISPSSDFDLMGELAEASRLDGEGLPTVEWFWGALGTDEARRLGCGGAAGDLCIDGSIGSRTAALVEPYADQATTGHLYLTADEIAGHVVACTEVLLQAGFHVIGDRGVAEVVAGFRAAADRLGEDRLRAAGHRLEHLEMVSSEQLAELARLGVTASVQPVFDAWWGGPGGLYETRLGARARGMNPYRSMADAGIVLAFGSDSPVTPMDPWLAVRAAVHHHEPSQRLGVRAAVRAHTAGGWRAAEVTARACGSDGSRLQRRRLNGEVAVGAPAYLAVWDVRPGSHTGDRDGSHTGDRDGDGDLDAWLAALVAPGRELPGCDLTIVGGRAAHDRHSEWPGGGR